ncbi:MAG: hypothetical protein ACTH34_05920 [Microbacterium gubbeenense]|uniref:hypothetical protein n=1 Tax=Microbacterium gubbeenense TaxID=159896 RepID=UPI003F9DD2C7
MIPETQAETLADRDMWAHRALTAEAKLAISRTYVEGLSEAPEHPVEAFHRVALLTILDHDAAPSGAAS